jgi:hypothetical protein
MNHTIREHTAKERIMIELAAALRDEVDRVSAVLRELDEREASQPRGAGRWTKREILGHLIDSAANNHQRFVRAQFTSPFTWPGYEQDTWVAVHGYRDRAWAELVELWAALNRHVAAVIERVPAEKLATPCTIGGEGPASLEWWMRDYLRHLRHHLAQLGAA